jgi:hypothetical protein
MAHLSRMAENQSTIMRMQGQEIDLLSEDLPSDKSVRLNALKASQYHAPNDRSEWIVEDQRIFARESAHQTSHYQEDGDATNSLPHEHSTAAQNLLTWPSVRQLLHWEHKTDYVFEEEENRGLLRVYGWGEGHDIGYGS